MLYFVFIIRDVKLLLLINNNDFILDHYREMYLIVDMNGFVVDASDALVEKFNLNIETNMTYVQVINLISSKAFIYKDAQEIENNYQDGKFYFHIKETRVDLRSSKYYGRLFLFYDETQIRLLMHKINYVMHHDLMTNLFNRNYFESIKIDYDGSNIPYSIILFDLDGLKLVNDFRGHEAGDDMLIRFSKSLLLIKENESRKIWPIRLGGDEFLMILNDYVEDDVLEVIKEIKNMSYDENIEKRIGFSYGYSTRNNHEEKMSQILKSADVKLYEMKKRRHAEKEKLVLYYQSMKSKNELK